MIEAIALGWVIALVWVIANCDPRKMVKNAMNLAKEEINGRS